MSRLEGGGPVSDDSEHSPAGEGRPSRAHLMSSPNHLPSSFDPVFRPSTNGKRVQTKWTSTVGGGITPQRVACTRRLANLAGVR
eukprot:6188442-Pleurochrysis_carterae.AAC.2